MTSIAAHVKKATGQAKSANSYIPMNQRIKAQTIEAVKHALEKPNGGRDGYALV